MTTQSATESAAESTTGSTTESIAESTAESTTKHDVEIKAKDTSKPQEAAQAQSNAELNVEPRARQRSASHVSAHPSARVSKLTKWGVVLGVAVALVALAHAHHPGVAQDPESRITRQYNAQVVDRQAYVPSWKRQRKLDLKLENEKGIEERLSKYKGQVVLLNFWASWCETCQEEIPDFEALMREMESEGRPFKVVMVSSDERWDELRAAVSRALMRDFGAIPLKNTHLDLYRDPTTGDEKQHRNYGTYKFPESYVIDKSGRVRLRFINTMPIRTAHGSKREWNEELVSYLKWLTRE